MAIWLADRQVHQRRAVADMYAQGADIPCGRLAVFAGGLRGADKDNALARAQVDRSRYLTVSLDLVLQELARRSLIPVVAGLSALEAADLVHGEAQHLAKRLAARAAADGRNLLLDITMASQPSVQNWLINLAQADYHITIVTAAISGPDAARWAEAEHRRGEEHYRSGRGHGGRYVPSEAILATRRSRQWPVISGLAVLGRGPRPRPFAAAFEWAWRDRHSGSRWFVIGRRRSAIPGLQRGPV